MNVAGARENVGSPVVQQSGIQCFNCKEFGHFAKECRKPKRVKDSAYHKEKMLLCKQAEKGVPLQAKQYDWLADTDEEINEQELEAYYSYMAKIQEVPTADTDIDSKPLEKVKKIQKQLKKENTILSQELKECKTILAETSKTLGESNSVRDSCLFALQNKQTKFEKYKAFNDHTIDYDKRKRKLNETLGQLAQKDIEIKEGYGHLIKTCLMPLALKTQNDSFIFVHELNQKMHADLKYVESLENKIDELESDKVEFSNMYDMILQERVNHKTNVSRPHHRSNQMKDKVVPNNSQVKLKKTQVEDHPRIPSISNKNKSVTACNDNLNSRTSNANVVCATCRKYVVDSNHFSCVTKMLNDVNARTKKPNVVPINTRKSKAHANKSVAIHHKKKVASKSTTQKPKSYYRMLSEKTSKAWKWWIEQLAELKGYNEEVHACHEDDDLAYLE
nr:hypothetical protein [Tanacetum cinerariifolium]